MLIKVGSIPTNGATSLKVTKQTGEPMIEYRKGNLLDVKSGIIAHGVNCQGVMGSGVALAVKKKWPDVFLRYQKLCAANTAPTKSFLGYVQFVSSIEDYAGTEDFPVIANCFTQDRYGTDKRHVDYDAVALCFFTLNYRSGMYGHLNIPKIGAGLGGGDWSVIESIIKSEYKDDVTVWEL